MTKRTESKAFMAFGIIIVLFTASVTFYTLLLGGDENPLMSMKFSDKVLIEAGATEIGEDHSVDSLNQFALDIYKELAKNNSDNVFFSPLSLYTVLSMTMEGARGETFTAMRNTLRITDDNSTRRGSFASIQNDLNSRKGCELSVANDVWVQNGVEVKSEYDNTIDDYYMASIGKAPFCTDPEGSRKMINDRISDETKGRISELIQPSDIDESVRAVLTNSIYFKGQWKYSFDPSKTEDRPFTLNDGSKVDAKTMIIDQTGQEDVKKFMASFNRSLDAVRMDYIGGDISMLFLLPGGMGSMFDHVENPMDITELDMMMDADFIEKTEGQLKPEEISLYIPKFSFNADYDMYEPLKDLDMGIAFEPNADFSGIMDESLFISKVFHKSFIEVNERGTEAVAASQATLCSATMDLILDHPFIFLIQDNKTGLILFMGRVMDPTQK